MARQVVGNPFENQIPTVSPTAQVVDTYYQPKPKEAPLAGLADALTRFSSKSKPILSQMEQRGIERELKEGQALYEQNRIAFGEAVKEGIIPEGASPYIMKGYRASMMQTLAMRYSEELDRELNAKRLYTSGDTGRIERFVSTFKQKFIEANGMGEFRPSEVSEFFGQSALKSDERFRNSWMSKHTAYVAEQAQRAFENKVAQATLILMDDSLTDEEHEAAKAQLAGYVVQASNQQRVDGVDNNRVIDMVLNGVGSAVEITGQTDILDVFDDIKFGTAAASKSLKIQTKIIDIESKALSLRLRREAEERRQDEQANGELRAQVNGVYFDFLDSKTPESRAALEAQLEQLANLDDERSVSLAVSIQNSLDVYDRQQNGANRSVETDANIDLLLRQAKTPDEASQVLMNAADRNEISSDAYNSYMSTWYQRYNPENDEQFGLDFNSTTTNEGRFLSDFISQIKGSEWDWDGQAAANVPIARSEWMLSYKDALTQWQKETGQTKPPLQWEAETATRINSMLIAKYQAASPDSELLQPSIPPLK